MKKIILPLFVLGMCLGDVHCMMSPVSHEGPANNGMLIPVLQAAPVSESNRTTILVAEHRNIDDESMPYRISDISVEKYDPSKKWWETSEDTSEDSSSQIQQSSKIAYNLANEYVKKVIQEENPDVPSENADGFVNYDKAWNTPLIGLTQKYDKENLVLYRKGHNSVDHKVSLEEAKVAAKIVAEKTYKTVNGMFNMYFKFLTNTIWFTFKVSRGLLTNTARFTGNVVKEFLRLPDKILKFYNQVVIASIPAVEVALMKKGKSVESQIRRSINNISHRVRRSKNVGSKILFSVASGPVVFTGLKLSGVNTVKSLSTAGVFAISPFVTSFVRLAATIPNKTSSFVDSLKFRVERRHSAPVSVQENMG